MTDPTSLPNFPPPAGEHPLRGRVLDALLDEGFRPDIDSDGDVAYKAQGQQLFVRCMEGDFDVMRVFGQWQIGAELADPVKQLRVCNDLTLRLNVIKLGIADGTLLVTGEHVVDSTSNLKALLAVTTQLVLSAVQLWHEAMVAADGDGGSEGPA